METSVYEQLEAIAGPIVQQYREDLRHDRRAIEESPGRQFLHFAGTSGTWLLGLPNEVPPGRSRGDVIHDVLRCVETAEDGPFPFRAVSYCDGSEVSEITWPEAHRLARHWAAKFTEDGTYSL
jgi:hypothetical protein